MAAICVYWCSFYCCLMHVCSVTQTIRRRQPHVNNHNASERLRPCHRSRVSLSVDTRCALIKALLWWSGWKLAWLASAFAAQQMIPAGSFLSGAGMFSLCIFCRYSGFSKKKKPVSLNGHFNTSPSLSVNGLCCLLCLCEEDATCLSPNDCWRWSPVPCNTEQEHSDAYIRECNWSS